MRVYLAGPLFSEAERAYLESVAERLETEGFDVFVPHRHTIDPLTPANVFAVDAAGVRDAHAVLAWLDGPMVDDGTACEIGMFAQLCAADPYNHAGVVGLVTDLRSFRRHAAGLPDAGVNLFVAGAIESCGKVALSLDGAVAQLLSWRDEQGLVSAVPNKWVVGSRPRTLPASVVPVVVGTAAAFGLGEHVRWWRAALAGVVALALQIATNYANDYSDGVKGTDDVRVGPVRLVASGLASPGAVKRAAFAAFGVAGLAGAVLALTTTPWLFVVGAASMLAGWFYTGGPKPYGYLGLGEVFVFVFFGLVATAGSTFVQVERLTAVSVVAGCAMGCLSCALLVVNNLRDIPTDTVAGKRTLAVRLGDARTRWFYVLLVAAAFGCAVAIGFARPGAFVALAAVVAAVAPVRVVRGGAKGPALIPVLGGTGRLQLVFGVLLALGIGLTH